jgi:hypothetical protein
MALINLPTISIDDSNIPRLRAAFRVDLGMAATDLSLTDAQLYKAWVKMQAQESISRYERTQAANAAAAAVAPPPDMT